MPFCPLMFQGLNEAQKEFVEKQWAEQKQQFMGRQKSTYEFRFEPAPGPRALKELAVLLETSKYTYLWGKVPSFFNNYNDNRFDIITVIRRLILKINKFPKRTFLL